MLTQVPHAWDLWLPHLVLTWARGAAWGTPWGGRLLPPGLEGGAAVFGGNGAAGNFSGTVVFSHFWLKAPLSQAGRVPSLPSSSILFQL